MVASIGKREKWAVTANWYRVSLRGDENVLYQEVVMAKQLCKYTTTHCIVHSKRVDFMVCELHCNKKRRGTRSRIDGRGN